MKIAMVFTWMAILAIIAAMLEKSNQDGIAIAFATISILLFFYGLWILMVENL